MSKFDLAVPHHIKPGKSVKLKDLSTGPSDKIDFGKKDAYERIAENAVEMAELAKKLYAEDARRRHGHRWERRDDSIGHARHEPQQLPSHLVQDTDR